MEQEDIAYCGLNCHRCKSRFSVIREKAEALNGAMEEVNFDEIAKVIPFMKFRYRGFNKIMGFLTNETCPGCRGGGGNPFCGIRKCATKKGYFSCAECESLCKKFNMLYRVHKDNEVQDNIATLRDGGIKALIEKYE